MPNNVTIAPAKRVARYRVIGPDYESIQAVSTRPHCENAR